MTLDRAIVNPTPMKRTIERELAAHRAVAEALCGMDTSPLEAAARAMRKTLSDGGRILVCGNGGSAADAQHFAAELVGRYRRERPACAAIALTTDTSILTAVGNDYGFAEIFARQVQALARKGDVVVALSTSGNSENVSRALAAGRAAGATTIAFSGKNPGRMDEHADLIIRAPSDETPRIQEAHITLLHLLSELVESELPA